MMPSTDRMKSHRSCFIILLFPTLLFAASHSAQPQDPKDQSAPPATYDEIQARDALNKGIADYKNAQYQDAIRDFTRAKHLDPHLLNARLHLATTYKTLYIPGSPAEDNIRLGQAAIQEFQELLALDSANLSAIDALGMLLFMTAGQPFDSAKFEESKSYHKKHIQLRPEDPEPYYWVGVIDWTLSFRANAELRGVHNREHPRNSLRDDQSLPSDLREIYRSEYGSIISEGIEHLQQASRLKPDFGDALAYLNLLYRRKADAVETAAERRQLMKMADDLVDELMKIKQKELQQDH
ncbi:MAG: hypothetical protein LAN84_16890 [Acidobacteriia bacterium]|nr:hypothetical protein [Terriglobia bacterium]